MTHGFALSTAASLVLAVASLPDTASAGGPIGPGNRYNPESFNPNWRVVFAGATATNLIDYCGRLDGTADDTWKPSSADLDVIDRALAPLLKVDLLSEGSDNQPGDYYRQYAVGDWRGFQVVYIDGFHKRYVALNRDAHGHDGRWKQRPVSVSDGGPSYWCAVYYRKDGKGAFAKIKQEGRPPRTVAFHGYA